jgi:hypothetical protein
MNVVEASYRKEQYDHMLMAFLECLALQKRHYMLVYLILTSLKSQNPVLPPYWESILSTVTSETSRAPYPPIERIFQKLSRCKDPDLIDALTFGGIPPYFSFFLTDFGITSFLDLLDSYSDQPIIYDCYARMAFAHSLFISFVSEVFQPILCPLLPDKIVPVFESLSENIQARWKQALPRMPPVVSQLLKRTTDPKRTLSQSFFDVALDCERAKVFGFVDYARPLTEELVILLRVLLTISSRHNILGELIALTFQPVHCKITFFTEEDRQTVSALFQPVLLSTFDFNAWAAVQLPGSSFVHPSSYEVRAYLHLDEEETLCIHNAVEGTMTIDHLRVEAALRHLLQDADTIPRFKKLPLGLTLETFFTEYLLKRGPRETYGRRYDNLTTIKWKSKLFSDERTILGALPKAHIERKKEIRALSAFTALWEIFAFTNNQTQRARDAIQEVFYSLPIFRWCPKYIKSPLPIYVRNPNNLLVDYLKLVEKWTIDPLFSTVKPEMLYTFLARELSFEAFRKSIPQLQQFDNELHELFEQHGNSLCDELFPVVPSPNWNKNQWLREQIEKLKSHTDFFEWLTCAALESGPIKKLREFGRAFNMVRKYFVENFPPSKDLGEDELLPAQIAFVIVVNPPRLASNLAYICEFCGSPRYERLFHQILVQPLSVLRMICRYLKNSQPLVDMGYISPQEPQLM